MVVNRYLGMSNHRGRRRLYKTSRFIPPRPMKWFDILSALYISIFCQFSVALILGSTSITPGVSSMIIAPILFLLTAAYFTLPHRRLVTTENSAQVAHLSFPVT